VAVGRLKHAAAVRYDREEFLGGEDLVEQFPAPFMDPGVPPFFVNPRRQIEEASMIPPLSRVWNASVPISLPGGPFRMSDVCTSGTSLKSPSTIKAVGALPSSSSLARIRRATAISGKSKGRG
jgi:hypothetical protein